MSELQEAYAHREAEVAEELAAMEVQSIAASEHWETGEVERDYLQLELAKSRTRNTELETQALETQVWVGFGVWSQSIQCNLCNPSILATPTAPTGQGV